jgi:D-alanyl-D-alanine carboxypeptidase (penicillin-binding protein 5/6)
VQNDFRIITVVLDADNTDSDEYARFTATGGLMNYIYGTWHLQSFASKGTKMNLPDSPSQLTVRDGHKKTVKVLPAENFSAVVPMDDPNIKTAITFNKKQNDEVIAGITKNQKLVKVTFHIKDSLGYLPGFEGENFYLTATKTIPRSNPLKVMWNHFVRFVNEKL